jgi:hypothetical protein
VVLHQPAQLLDARLCLLACHSLKIRGWGVGFLSGKCRGFNLCHTQISISVETVVDTERTF